MIRLFAILFSVLLGSSTCISNPKTSGEIRQALKKLNVLGSFLYIAAHPDDENTRLISYMANEKLVETAYLSLTRGDGGQNLIGTEKGELMGLLRTQELMEARKIDGGNQFFTRAVDFGYSKTSEETFTKWDKQKILADVVWVIRKFKPDVLVTRFPPNSYAGHGHHSASAILAEEAFELAGNPKSFPEQLKYVKVWQPTRLYFNNSTWWDKELDKKVKENGKDYVMIDVGAFNKFKGQSYTEIAAESRSMHKSQGFGSSKERGRKIEYLQYKKGKKASEDLFDGVDISWKKVGNGQVISKMIDSLYNNFEDLNPEKTIDGLLTLHKIVKTINNSYWKEKKLVEIEDLILACGGIWLESRTDEFSAVTGQKISVKSTLINRSDYPVFVKKIAIGGKDSIINQSLSNNSPLELSNLAVLPQWISNPYWLKYPFEGVFEVKKQNLIGDPENKPSVETTFYLELGGKEFAFKRPLIYKWTDRVKGELYRPFVVLPDLTANLEEKVYVFGDRESKKIRITLKAHKSNVEGFMSFQLPSRWSCKPASVPYNLKEKGEEQVVELEVFPPKKQSVGDIKIFFREPAKKFVSAKSYVTIEYDHVPIQTLLPLAQGKVVRLNVETKGTKIGYIPGAGDEVPKGLEQLGYSVKILTEAEVINSDLSQFNAILSGIRAYNTQSFLKHHNKKLMDYVKNGGNYIVQYNTNRGLVTEDIGPYPFKLSRDRVTVEEAKVKFINEKSGILSTPNKITEKDFEGWVQERGLYFPNEWDDNYSPILEWNDPGEDSKKGALLVSKYGEGTFIYTGISFFRELPAGVPGAFKLMANIISYSKETHDRNEK